jgi:hypothetical protein
MQVKGIIFIALLFFTSDYAFSLDYPKGPDAGLTPGSLCDRPTEYRYPERIAYCERDVPTHVKTVIFDLYRDQLGYKLEIRRREDYKIDHFIPLCAGGSNHENNLWPQHISIFTITDPLESTGCEKLKDGRITQLKLVELIRQAKRNIADAPRILKMIQAL